MMYRIRNTAMPVTLLALCLGLSWNLYLEVSAPLDIFAPEARIEPEESDGIERKASIYRAPPKSNFSSIFDRPIFEPGRRPLLVSAAEDAAPSTGLQKPDFQLTGIVMRSGQGTAIIGTEGGGQPVSLKVGDRFRGWRVVAIMLDFVMLRQGDQESTLYIEFPAQQGSGAVVE